MQISEVLSIHGLFEADHAHSDILGDAFLMQKNPVYKNIKLRAIEIGCNYVEVWPEYLLMPFHQLGHIVATKTIPYVPSRRLLQAVEDKRADVLSTNDLQIPESYHLHESAHVIAENIFSSVGGDAQMSAQEKILKAIICESFANTVDALACTFAGDEVHGFFLRQNCYMHPNKKYVSVISRLNKSFGPRFTFIFTLISYVHANFLRELMPVSLIREIGERYAPDVKISETMLKDCESLRKMAERLDPQFRVQTTKMYLNLEGYDGEAFEILDFEFMKVFEAKPVFHKATEAMAEIVT